MGEEERNVFWIVLTIGVEGDEIVGFFPGGVSEGGHKGGALPWFWAWRRTLTSRSFNRSATLASVLPSSTTMMFSIWARALDDVGDGGGVVKGRDAAEDSGHASFLKRRF